MAPLARHAVALVAAAVGYLAGLVAGVAILGLSEGASVAPLTTSTAAGLATGLALGMVDGRRHLLARTAWGLGAGLVVGLVCWSVDPRLEWVVGALVVLSQVIAWTSRPAAGP